jgi:alkylhydroperoxidase family enzyme
MSLRLAVAKDEGLDEVMAAKVDRYEASDLPDHHKAALRLADALMTQPGSIEGSLRDELRRHFSDDQLVELTVDVMKWNYQKVTVALGTDDEVRPGQLTDLLFDDEGNWVRPG